jgi:hypothetical protein
LGLAVVFGAVFAVACSSDSTKPDTEIERPAFVIRSVHSKTLGLSPGSKYRAYFKVINFRDSTAVAGKVLTWALICREGCQGDATLSLPGAPTDQDGVASVEINLGARTFSYFLIPTLPSDIVVTADTLTIFIAVPLSN